MGRISWTMIDLGSVVCARSFGRVNLSPQRPNINCINRLPGRRRDLKPTVQPLLAPVGERDRIRNRGASAHVELALL
jgi:hypothetical protein